MASGRPADIGCLRQPTRFFCFLPSTFCLLFSAFCFLPSAFPQSHYTATPTESLTAASDTQPTATGLRAAHWALKNSAKGSGTSTSVSTPAFSSALTNPSIIVVAVMMASGSPISTPTDTAGNTYLDCGAGMVNARSGTWPLEVFYAQNTHTTASNVLTVTYSSSVAITMYAAEFTGGLTSSPVDQHASVSMGTATGNTPATPPVSTTMAGELLVGFGFGYNGALKPGSGFTGLLADWRLEYEIAGAPGSPKATWGDAVSGDSYGAILMTLEPAAQSYTSAPGETNATGDSLTRQAAYWRGDAISISWTPPAGASGNSAYAYNIYRGTSPGNETGPINASPVDAGCTGNGNCTYVDYGPQAGAEYYYEVTAVNGGIESAVSNETGTVIAADTILETNTAGDALGRLAGFVRGPVEASTTADWVARGQILQRAVAETLLGSDALSGAREKYLGQSSHQAGVPGRLKGGAVPGRAKAAEAPAH